MRITNPRARKSYVQIRLGLPRTYLYVSLSFFSKADIAPNTFNPRIRNDEGGLNESDNNPSNLRIEFI
jgi:hypothetical protein